MTQELVPGSVAADDNLRIAIVPSGNWKSVAVLVAGTTKDLTYSLKAFNRAVTEATVDDPRLTLKQLLQTAGRVTESLEVQYVFGAADDVARVALAEGTTGFIVPRYAIPNATAWTIAQVVDGIPFRAGRQRKDPPTENGVWTITQTLFVTGVVENDAVLVA